MSVVLDIAHLMLTVAIAAAAAWVLYRAGRWVVRKFRAAVAIVRDAPFDVEVPEPEVLLIPAAEEPTSTMTEGAATAAFYRLMAEKAHQAEIAQLNQPATDPDADYYAGDGERFGQPPTSDDHFPPKYWNDIPTQWRRS